jgi:hypothetical protein
MAKERSGDDNPLSRKGKKIIPEVLDEKRSRSHGITSTGNRIGH